MRIIHVTTYLIAVSLTATYKIEDYCSAKAKCGTDDNSVCKRKAEQCKIAKDCIGGGKPDLSMMSDKDRQEVIDVHNLLREKCASGAETRGGPGGMPKASNMEVFSYDLELEFSSQCLTNSCNYNHDKCTKTPKYNGVGQNLYQCNGIPLDIKVAVTEWYDEVKIHVKNQKYDQSKLMDIGHFTQVIHAKTTKVGCGKTIYGEKGDSTFFACNYFPGGNTGTDMYYVGEPQSKCVKGVKNDKYKSLCGEIVPSPKFLSPFAEGGSGGGGGGSGGSTSAPGGGGETDSGGGDGNNTIGPKVRSGAEINLERRPILLITLLILIKFAGWI